MTEPSPTLDAALTPDQEKRIRELEAFMKMDEVDKDIAFEEMLDNMTPEELEQGLKRLLDWIDSPNEDELN